MRNHYARRVARTCAIAGAVFLASCPAGTTAGKFGPARGPGGIVTIVELSKKSYFTGEVLQVQDTALLMRSDREIVLVPYRTIRRAKFPGLSQQIRKGEWQGPDAQQTVRLSSRFPHGLADEHLKKLLAETGQTEPRRLTP